MWELYHIKRSSGAYVMKWGNDGKPTYVVFLQVTVPTLNHSKVKHSSYPSLFRHADLSTSPGLMDYQARLEKLDKTGPLSRTSCFCPIRAQCISVGLLSVLFAGRLACHRASGGEQETFLPRCEHRMSPILLQIPDACYSITISTSCNAHSRRRGLPCRGRSLRSPSSQPSTSFASVVRPRTKRSKNAFARNASLCLGPYPQKRTPRSTRSSARGVS